MSVILREPCEWFSTVAVLPPRGILAKSGDVTVVTRGVGGLDATGI